MSKVCLTLISLMSLPLGAATMVSVPAMVDGYVQSSGVLGRSTGDTDNVIGTSRSGGVNVRHGVYEFDLSFIPVGSTITSATLQLTTSRFVSNTGGNPAEISIYGYVGDGVVGTDDFGTDPTPTVNLSRLLLPTGTGPDGTATGSTLNFVLNDLTEITAAYNSPDGIFGTRSQTRDFVSFQVASLENTTYSVPTLVVNYIPEPGSSTLLLLGLAGLMTRRVRR